ncbi:MAG: TM2 domain-containing protein [Proteobacteria bacterium]|nr:TM2 domain-containing protein [Pseudomonadota bacterium]
MAMIYCYECGKKYSESAEKCPHCGAPNRGKGGAGEKQWLVAFLLCLFLGAFGAHRFYLRQTASAIVMLILGITFVGLIVTGIWALVDLIILLCHAGDDNYVNKIAKRK